MMNIVIQSKCHMRLSPVVFFGNSHSSLFTHELGQEIKQELNEFFLGGLLAAFGFYIFHSHWFILVVEKIQTPYPDTGVYLYKKNGEKLCIQIKKYFKYLFLVGNEFFLWYTYKLTPLVQLRPHRGWRREVQE